MSSVNIHTHHTIVAELKSAGYTNCDIANTMDNSYYKMIHKAIGTIDALGMDYFNNNTCMGVRMKEILYNVLSKI